MDAVSYSQVRKNFAKTMNKVCSDHNPIIITRQKQNPVVMISLDDYNSLQETLYLVKNPANSARLSVALQEIEEKKFVKKDLIE